MQENCIDLVGRIADRGAEFVPAREWMRICFELLDMLKARQRRCWVWSLLEGSSGGWQRRLRACRCLFAPRYRPLQCRLCPRPPAATQAHKKAIRRATVNTFGYIAKAIGPQDVLVTLLNNLKVQERQVSGCGCGGAASAAWRGQSDWHCCPAMPFSAPHPPAALPSPARPAQNRVCTTVAIAIVAETCAPFTVLPALMNEYKVRAGCRSVCCGPLASRLAPASARSASLSLTCLLCRCAPPQVPELNVQNGVLKALSFLFEYIGEMGKDYIYAGEWGPRACSQWPSCGQGRATAPGSM